MAARTLLTLQDLPGNGAKLADRLAECRDRIAESAARAGRDAKDVELLVVTKYVDVDVLQRLSELGIRSFGENRIQEVVAKRATLEAIDGARVHFIGHIQRNKLKKLRGVVQTIHSLDSVRLLEALEACYEDHPDQAPDLYLEANISSEGQKTGLATTELPDLARRVSESSIFATRVRGIMGMAARSDDPEGARSTYAALRALRDKLIDQKLLPPTAGLSMGMSRDYGVAVEEGATIVRVGSGLFQ